MISQTLLSILVCPACRAKLELNDGSLTCAGCHLVYPIKNGIPLLLVDEAAAPGVVAESPEGESQ